MKVSPITPSELGQRLRVRVGESVSRAGVADLAREAVGRWDLVRAAQLRRWLRGTLEATGSPAEEASAAATEVLEAMVALRELELLNVEATPESEAEEGTEVPEGEEPPLPIRAGAHVAVPLPRVVELAESSLLLGDVAWPGAADRAGVARWVGARDAERAMDEGAELWGPSDWLGAPGWYAHVERRACPDRDPGALWRALEERFGEYSSPISDPSGLWAVVGRPGRYYGRIGDADGRWRQAERAPDGMWCGVAPGHNERHWRPMLLSVNAGSIRSMPLWDHDELRWALISRGVEEAAPEQIHLRDGAVSVTFPMPEQLWRLRHLCSPESGWRWSAPAGLRLEAILRGSGVAVQ